MSKAYLTAGEIVEKVGIHITTLYRWINEGKFPKPDLGGNKGFQRRWKAETFEQWETS